MALLTVPTGLKLTVDGNSNFTSYDFIWPIGTTHQVSAAATQTGANGRVYTFQGWSNQGNASQPVAVTQGMATSGYWLTANYNELSRVVVQSLPARRHQQRVAKQIAKSRELGGERRLADVQTRRSSGYVRFVDERIERDKEIEVVAFEIDHGYRSNMKDRFLL